MKPAPLSYRERIVSLGLQLQLRAGELVNVEVRHASDCDLLHVRGPSRAGGRCHPVHHVVGSCGTRGDSLTMRMAPANCDEPA